ncbi:unnamed protein product [Peronospora destructor]|nr:unnamed protein product [Peronospora destructor]
MGRYPQAEEYLAIGYSAALKRLHQLDVALNCAYWLSKSYAETGALKKALKTLDAAIVTAEKKPMVAPTADMFEKLLLARVDLLDAEINVGAAESKLFKDHLREFQLWHTLSYFDGKGQIYNHVRTAEVLLHFLERKSGDADRQHSDMMQVLALVDGVNVGELSTSTGPTEAKELLIKLLCDLDIPGSANSSHPYELRIGALLKLVDICIHENEDELNEEVCKFLEEAINVLRANKGIDTAVSKARLVVLLPKVARWKAARGNIVGAKEILEENVQLLRGASDFNSDLLFESLVGLCVVQIRLGMLEEATQVMNESYLCSIGPVWWSQWCGPLLACVAAVAMVFMIL